MALSASKCKINAVLEVEKELKLIQTKKCRNTGSSQRQFTDKILLQNYIILYYIIL
jgi:hypothetical protein